MGNNEFYNIGRAGHDEAMLNRWVDNRRRAPASKANLATTVDDPLHALRFG